MIITDLFSHKIHSSGDDWPQKLIEIASVFAEFDGMPYDRAAIEERFTQISPRASIVARDPENGEVSTIVPDYLTDCWKYYRKKFPLIEHSELKIEILPATTYCEDCRQTYPTVEFGRQCPYCKSPNTYLVCGDECNIKEIEAQ